MMLFITHIIFILIILVTFSANDLISESCHYTQGQSSGCQTVSMIVVLRSQPRSQPYEPASKDARVVRRSIIEPCESTVQAEKILSGREKCL